MGSPRDAAATLERSPPPPGNRREETHVGYGIMGLPFDSGHVLALRRFVTSSVGNAYTSVWHRSPSEEWTVYSDVALDRSCPRYFGGALHEATRAPIGLAWEGPDTLRVKIPGHLDWRARIAPTRATRAMTAMAQVMPSAAWRSHAILAMMGRVAGRTLHAGTMRMMGTTPNGQRFRVAPKRVWAVVESSATVDGGDVGAPAALAEQAMLGEFRIPQRGLFAVGSSTFEAFDGTRHRADTSIKR